MPIIVAAIQIGLLAFIFKEEPVDFCIGAGREEEAIRLMKRVYKKQDDQTDLQFDLLVKAKLQLLRKTTTIDSSTISTSEAVCGQKFRKAFWVLFFVNTFTQQSGIAMITMYVGSLLGRLADQTNGAFPISPAVGGNCIGIASCIFSFLAGPLVKYMGRKWIMVLGCFGMGFSHIMAGVSLMQTWYLVAFGCIIAYISIFNLTMANVSFLYTAEVAVDAAAGICIGVQFLNIIQISFTAEYMIGGWL